MGLTSYARLRFEDEDEQFLRQGEHMGPFVLVVRCYEQCLYWAFVHWNHGYLVI